MVKREDLQREFSKRSKIGPDSCRELEAKGVGHKEVGTYGTIIRIQSENRA